LFRIRRSKIYTDKAYRGYQASKRRYFYGLKVHLLVTASRHPVEFFVTPASTGDVEGLQWFDFDLPPGYGDKAYNNYEIEDIVTSVVKASTQEEFQAAVSTMGDLLG
jgi:hypothetical protein